MAIFLYHTGCPKCGSSDALAHYSDGGTYCFSCGIPSGASIPSFESAEEEEDAPLYPKDLTLDFPDEVLAWIKPTTVSIYELIRHQCRYSRATPGLVRLLGPSDDSHLHPVLRDRRGNYEVRFFYTSPKVPGRTTGSGQGTAAKTKFFGSKENVFAYSYKGPYNPLQPSTGSESSVGSGQESNHEENGTVSCHPTGRRHQLVIVEDSLSSIRVGREVPCAPLFGSTISNTKLVKLIQPFDEIIVWLDSNKLHVARQIADRCKFLGKKTRVIYTELDPKYLNPLDWI